MAPPTKLYRRTGDGMEYWEHWTDDGGTTLVHSGKVGERGEVERFDDRDAFVAHLAEKTHELYREGFRNIPEDEHETVLVVWPRDGLPADTGELDALWEKIERWVNEELGWTGLGHCTGVDLSTELVAMGAVVDADLAVKVLAAALVQSDLPAGGVIAVRTGGERDEVRWPPERAGEDV